MALSLAVIGVQDEKAEFCRRGPDILEKEKRARQRHVANGDVNCAHLVLQLDPARFQGAATRLIACLEGLIFRVTVYSMFHTQRTRR